MISNGESIVAQQMTSFAMALLRFNHDDIQCGERFLKFKPRLAASSRTIGTRTIFGDEAFVSCSSCSMKSSFYFRGTANLMNDDSLKQFRQQKAFQILPPHSQRLTKEADFISPKHIKHNVANRDIRGHK